MSKEAVYGLSVCEDCNKSTEVLYKCWEQDGYSLEVENIVYRCYECAFEQGMVRPVSYKRIRSKEKNSRFV